MQIDTNILMAMDDNQLIDIGLHRLGDRVALKVFCRTNQGHSSDVDFDTHRSDLIARIKAKQSGVRNRGRAANSAHMTGNKHAKKTLRRVDMGWLHYDATAKCFRQVRQQLGGGTRKLQVDVCTQLRSLIDIGRDLFFPDGQSAKGSVSDYEFDIRSFDHSPVDHEMTIELFVERTKMKLPHLYLATTSVWTKSAVHSTVVIVFKLFTLSVLMQL